MDITKAKPAQFPFCNACGSAGVISDASARWCMSAQDWDLSGVQDYKCCEACGSEDIWWERKPTENLSECQNCGESWHIDHLKDAQDLAQRVAPGEPMPAGECPACGALCHLWQAAKPKAPSPDLDAIAEAETAYKENRDNDELQIDRANPAALIMRDAIWVKSWTRVRAIEGGTQ
jgi:hypothetical protein